MKNTSTSFGNKTGGSLGNTANLPKSLLNKKNLYYIYNLICLCNNSKNLYLQKAIRSDVRRDKNDGRQIGND